MTGPDSQTPDAQTTEHAQTPGTHAVGDASAARPERGDELELEIDSLAHGGEGVARFGDGGYVVFVSGAIPGDRVRAEVIKRKRSYAHARTLEVLRESPERIPPTAHHPGVAWQVLPYERQLEIKQQQVVQALRRIGRLEGFELEEVVPAVQQWRYRNKLEYSFGELAPASSAGEGSAAGLADVEGCADGLADEGSAAGLESGEDFAEGAHTRARGLLVCGFHAPGGWKRVEPIDDCLLASERGNLARAIALGWCREQGLGAWDRRRESIDGATPLLRNLVVREGRRTGMLQVRLVTTSGKRGAGASRSTASGQASSVGARLATAPHALLDVGELALALATGLGEQHLSGVLWTRSDALAETTLGGDTELVWGEPYLPERLGELDLRISPETFFQTNTEMAEVLYGVAAEYAHLQGWERVFDLYCGIGTIALTLAPRAGEVWGIEIVQDAVADAIAAAKRNEISGARFFAGDARLALPELIERAGRPDVVVVDPPRAGLSQKVVRRIIDASPKRVVYVSCNPTTLAPNAAQLVEAGWRLVKVRPVDMFPQTPHIECVALLERDGASRLSVSGAGSSSG
jgi:23S rRNA (uracil1939-C5)-methyltransferase